MTVRIKVVDKGAEKLLKKMKSRMGVKIGIVGKSDGDSVEGTTIAYIGAIHEFGVDTGRVKIPRRSWLRGYINESAPILRKRLRRSIVHAMHLRKTRSLTGAMQVFGAVAAGEIQRRIARGIPPPNAPITIEIKGSSKPLIDTGRLRQSITYEVTGGEK